ncbi:MULTISPECIES: IS110 family transposase [unclassified Mesorhizobium]|uniref:IS110 family transposase n=1 Tax=unclassified Mesorhizobium TaxID=325217 RepID=UPI001FEDC81C|nr:MULTISPECIES: IS110 family transposase [unclassified Mesorhizobium]
MSQTKWLIAATVRGFERNPLKKLDADPDSVLRLLRRWRSEAIQAGREVRRIVVAYEAGRDGFWLTRWLQARAVEAYVIHPSSVAVSREHRRAKTDCLDTELLMRALLGWLRARSATAAWQPSQPSMRRRLAVRTVTRQSRPRTYTDRQSRQSSLASAFVPSNPICAKLPRNWRLCIRRKVCRYRNEAERSCAVISDGFTCCVNKSTRSEQERLRQLSVVPDTKKGPLAMVRLLSRIVGVGIETADMLVNEILSRGLRDWRAVARYAGLAGRRMRAANAGARKVLRGPATLASATA